MFKSIIISLLISLSSYANSSAPKCYEEAFEALTNDVGTFLTEREGNADSLKFELISYTQKGCLSECCYDD